MLTCTQSADRVCVAEHKPNQTNTKDLTFNSGLGVPDNDHSLTLGARGEPPLLTLAWHSLR